MGEHPAPRVRAASLPKVKPLVLADPPAEPRFVHVCSDGLKPDASIHCVTEES
jgi:hypothetical protein